MPLEPRASWFSPKCIEAQQLTGHLRVKHCFVAGRESGFYIFPLSRSVGKKWTLENFTKLPLACPWIQQQFKRLTYSGIFRSTLIFNSLNHFVAYYALPRLWVPRYPP
ncbi:hypothetical protein Bca4012_098392 [Brassica carinata]